MKSELKADFGSYPMRQTSIKETWLSLIDEPVSRAFLSPDDEHCARFLLLEGSSGIWFLHDEGKEGSNVLKFDTLLRVAGHIRRS